MNALRVVKVGGSLFDYDDLVPALRKWLSREPPLTTILIAGGGPLTDAIRAADARFGLGEEASHSLCVRALGVSARLLAELLPEAEVEAGGVKSLIRRLAGERTSAPFFVFDPESFLRDEEPLMANPLPHTWNVTSDSIAARVAEALEAEELVLLKSSTCENSTTLTPALSGYVDAHFPQASASLNQVRAVNLRDGSFAGFRFNIV